MLPLNNHTPSLDELVTAKLKKRGDAQLLRNQLFLVPFGKLHQEIKDSFNALIIDEPTQKHFAQLALSNLPLFDKISVLARSIGIVKTCKFLDKTAHLSDQNRLATMLAFTNEVQALTNIRIYAPQLSSLRVLQMLLFAAFDTCSKHLKEINYLDSNGALIPFNKIFNEMAYEAAHIIQFMHHEKEVAEMELSWDIFKKNFALLKISLLEDLQKKGKMGQNVLTALDRIDQIFGLLQKAATAPLHLKPLLRAPVTQSNTQDQKELSFVNDFFHSFKFQLDLFISKFAVGKKDKKELKTLVESLMRNCTIYHENLSSISNQWKSYQQLSIADQFAKRKILENIIEFSKSLSDDNISKAYFKLLEKIKGLNGNPKGNNNLFDACVQYPFSILLALVDPLSGSIINNCRLQIHSFKVFEKILHENYRTLPQISVVELLAWQTRNSMHYLIQSNPEYSEVLWNLESDLGTIFNEMQVAIREDFFKTNVMMGCSKLAITSSKTLTKILPLLKVKDHEIANNIFLLSELLKETLFSSEWLRIFAKTPFQSKEQPHLEKEFYCNSLSSLLKSGQQRFLSSLDAMRIFLQKNSFLPHEQVLIDQAAVIIDKFEKSLLDFFKNVPNLVNGSEFIKATGAIWDCFLRLQDEVNLQIDTLELKIETYTHTNPQTSQGFSIFLEIVPHLRDFVEVMIFIPGQEIFSYLIKQELIEAEDQNSAIKIQTLVESKTDTPVLKAEVEPVKAERVSPIELPADIRSDFQKLKSTIQTLNEFHQSSQIPAAAGAQEIEKHHREREHTANLLRNMSCLQELMHLEDNRLPAPYILLEAYERVAILLEQSKKLACLQLNLKQSDSDEASALLQDRGQECFSEAHALLPLAALIERDHFIKKQQMLFKPVERQLMGKLASFIGITYRCPASDREDLFHINLKNLKDLLKNGLLIAQKVMHIEGAECSESRKPIPLHLLQTCFQITEVSSSTAPPSLKAMELKLAGIKRFLSLPRNKKLSAIDDLETTREKRTGTLDSNLRNLSSNFSLCRAILEGPTDPALVVTTLEALLSREAVLFEQMLLILLAYLPIQGATSDHFLWDPIREKPLRYSHNLISFTQALQEHLPVSLYQRCVKLADKLQSYLKNGHRYASQPCSQSRLLNKFTLLSEIRLKVLPNQLLEEESRFLDEALSIEDPSQRLNKLDAYIIRQFAEAKNSVNETLLVIDELSEIFKDLLGL